MQNTNTNNDQSTELMDSLMHTNVKRMVTGVICGLIAGVVMLLITAVIPMGTYGKLWWLQLTASTVFQGKAFLADAPAVVYVVGAIVHFAIAAFCGFIVGKMTTRNDLPRLLFYTFVLGFLCWLSSNMFAPDFVDYQFLITIGQWLRVIIFMGFTLSLGVLMSIFGKALKV